MTGDGRRGQFKQSSNDTLQQVQPGCLQTSLSTKLPYPTHCNVAHAHKVHRSRSIHLVSGSHSATQHSNLASSTKSCHSVSPRHACTTQFEANTTTHTAATDPTHATTVTQSHEPGGTWLARRGTGAGRSCGRSRGAWRGGCRGRCP